MSKTTTAYKAFNSDWTCRGFQYEVGKSYKHDGPIKPCESGFHACENPLGCLEYYPPTGTFALVDLGGETIHEDKKTVASEITIKAELSLQEFLQKGVDYILSKVDFDNADATNTGNQSAATNTGHWSAATNTGHWSAATNTGHCSVATNTGNRSVATNTGNRSAATNTGYQSAATNTGYRSAATNTGYQSAATNTGYQSAATNTGYQSAATNTGNRSVATNTGNQSAATNTGYQSAATNTGHCSVATNTGNRSVATNTGYRSAASVSGDHSVAISTGFGGKAMASTGSAIVLCERDENGEILNIYSGIAGKDCEPDTWYTLKNGKLEKCK